MVSGVLLRALGFTTAGGRGSAGGTAGAAGHLGHGGAQQEQEGESWDSHSGGSGYQDTTVTSVYISSLLYTHISALSLVAVEYKDGGSCFSFSSYLMFVLLLIWEG